MVVGDIFSMGFFNLYTGVVIRSDSMPFKVLAKGFYNSADVLRYIMRDVSSFAWQDDNTVYIDIV